MLTKKSRNCVMFFYAHISLFSFPVIENYDQGRQRRKNDPTQYMTPGDAVLLYRNSMVELAQLVAPYVERPEDIHALPPGARKLLAIDVRQ